MDPLTFTALKRIVGEVHRGFGCGPDSRFGIHLDVHLDGPDAVVAVWTPGARDEGPQGIVHGGVQGIVADALAGWASTVHQVRTGVDPLRFPVTASMTLRYRAPLPVGVPLTLRAGGTQEAGRRHLVTVTMGTPDEPRCTVADVVYHMLDRPWFANPRR